MKPRIARLQVLVRTLAASGAAAFLLGVHGIPAAWPSAAAAGGPQQGPFPVETAKAEQAMNELQQALLAKLKTTMESGGPAAAVEVCRTEARTIAAAVAKREGIDLGRTSHRVRNPANAPRPWARAIVEGGAGVKAAAERIRVVDLGERVGVLRPIGTVEMCMRCHGPADVVRRSLGDALAKVYPQDRATGFSPGDLRGWMWAEVPKSAK